MTTALRATRRTYFSRYPQYTRLRRETFKQKPTRSDTVLRYIAKFAAGQEDALVTDPVVVGAVIAFARVKGQ